MKICVISGDYYHPAEVIEKGLNALPVVQNGEVQLEFLPDTINWQRGQIEDFDVVLLCKGNSKSPSDGEAWLTPEVQQEIVDYIENGGAVLVIHAGTVGYKNDSPIGHLIGGTFQHHPKPGEVQVSVETTPFFAISPQDFTIHDEHYWMDMFHNDMNVFMTSRQDDATQPAGWTRQQGKGRVCVLTPGHYLEVWQHPAYQQLLEAALHWCVS